MDPLEMGAFALLVGAGVVTGVINTVAGSGAVVSLSALLLLGVPAEIANASSRAGALFQGIAALGEYKRRGELRGLGPRKRLVLCMTVAGTACGVLGAVALPRGVIEIAIGVVLVSMLPMIWLRRAGHEHRELGAPISMLVFFAVGFYGGMLNAGVGILLLICAETVEGLEYVESNVLKLMATTVAAALTVVIFAFFDLVDWRVTAALAVGQAVGGVLGSRVSTTEVLKRYLRWVLTALIGVSLVKLIVGAL